MTEEKEEIRPSQWVSWVDVQVFDKLNLGQMYKMLVKNLCASVHWVAK